MAGCQGGSVAEVAMEAWMECEPWGYVAEERRIRGALPAILARVPRAGAWRQAVDMRDLFTANPSGDPPVFLRLLRAQGGKVHFLYFWKAFGEVARMCGPGVDDGLATELENLRDRVLRRLEEESRRGPGGPVPMANWTVRALGLVDEASRASAMSACPKFWQAFVQSLVEQQRRELSLEDLTNVLLSLLRFVPAWEDPASVGAQPPAPPVSAVEGNAGADKLLVRLNIYDVSREESIQKLNRVLAHEYSPLKLGGVFHAGVEVNGLEWSFGFSPLETHPGVSCVQPRKHPQHHYRQTVVLRTTKVAAEDIPGIISNMVEEYPGYDYDLLRRNCCHFADDLCRRLGVGGIPGWIHRLARLGAGIDNLMRRM